MGDGPHDGKRIDERAAEERLNLVFGQDLPGGSRGLRQRWKNMINAGIPHTEAPGPAVSSTAEAEEPGSRLTSQSSKPDRTD
jgi:hypothetical protein